MLWRMITMAKSCLQAFLSFQTLHLFHLTFSSWPRLCYVLIVYVRLIFFEITESSKVQAQQSNHRIFDSPLEINCWDPVLAAQEADMPRLVALLQEKLLAVTSDAVGSGRERDAMFYFGFLLKGMMAGYGWRMREEQSQNSTGFGHERTHTQAHLSHGVPDVFSTAGMAQEAFDAENVIGVERGLAYGVPSDLPQQFFQELIWETMLEDFTMLPLP